MAPAWLDSLSEDWVSQPGSDHSGSPLPALAPSQDTNVLRERHLPSRIPRKKGNRSSAPPTSEHSSIVLAERTANDINISMRRLPSKLSREVRADTSLSLADEIDGSDGSVVQNKFPNRSSPSKDQQTPEWKRRLVYGEIPYGEQRDLFCSTAAGLEDMFKPPQEEEQEPRPDCGDGAQYPDVTLPSSPPTHDPPLTKADFLEEDVSDEGDAYTADVTPSPSPRPLQKELSHKPADTSPIQIGRRSSALSSNSRARRENGKVGERPIENHSVVHDSIEQGSRKTSGETDIRNEDFSPISIGKHDGDNDSIGFAPFDVPVDQLWQKLERLRVNQMLLDSQADLQAGPGANLPKIQGDIESTEDYMHNGGFINARRGGRSGEGSFYYRGLSSEFGADTSEMLPEESLQASTPKQFPSIRTLGTNPFPTLQTQRSPSLPRAPFPSPEKRQHTHNEASKSENSPLKLFGPYDTFTNQILLRRISQFEEGSGSPSQRSPVSHNGDEVLNIALEDSAAETHVDDQRNISRFGEKDLDGYEFKGNSSDEICEDPDAIAQGNVTPIEQLLPAYPLRAIPSLQMSDESHSGLRVSRRRSKSEANLQPGHGVQRASIAAAVEVPSTPKRDSASESKRQRNSPSKDPTPKRRRTLHRSDIAFGREIQAQESSHSSAKEQVPLLGKKRKDALAGNFEVAGPDVLAQRSILLPQSLGKHRISFAPFERAEELPPRSMQKGVDAIFNDAVTETDRKPSIRTQDFVDQAAHIMAKIRNQLKPEPASLGELEEEDFQKGEKQPLDVVSNQDSTNEPFSRPPSREGNPIAWAHQRQDDPELLNRLKKYRELSDVGDLIPSSVRSTVPIQGADQDAPDSTRQAQDQRQSKVNEKPIPILGEVTSDLPNVRLSNGSVHVSGQRSPSRECHSHSSNRSAGHNYPSGSSRGSESRRIIMPESICHLIPDRVGTMCLDKDKNVWVKRKESSSGHQLNALPSEDSEEDPFASIPDLTVDMTKEMQNLKLAVVAEEATENDETGSGISLRSDGNARRTPSKGLVTVSTSQPSASCTDAFMTEQIARLVDSNHNPCGDSEKFGECQDEKRCDQPSNRQRRNMTISFSSPIASVIRQLTPDDLDDLEDEAVTDALTDTSRPLITTRPLRKKSNQAPLPQMSLRGQAFIPRPVSRIDEQDEEEDTVAIRSKDCHEDRQVSILGESIVKTPNTRQTSMDLIINQTPGKTALALVADDSAIIGRNVGKLSLSPLSEFTFNNADQSFGFEVSYVMGIRHMATGNGSKKVMSMTIRDLVDRLGEAEPQESFWEDLTELDLHDKRLASLHMLDEFCGRLIALDASANKLNHLNGIPSTVRELKVSHNLLTEITSWDHLMNLQYLDISDNEITSLSALKHLVHLRSVKADNNRLTSLDGLDAHDGLLCLRARNNEIMDVDFSESQFQRLEELDLASNQIASVRNLNLLPVLAKLKLSKNRLKQLPDTEHMRFLRQLDISDNELEILDVGIYPNLHSIHADRNRIRFIRGFDRTRRLDSLSLREQRGQGPLDLTFLDHAYEVRKLFLSGNFMHQFNPQVDFLNLQFLELANCGLQHLPEKMGQLMPNLRTLNINFNAINDLSPLQFIPRLKKLLVAGNRLAESNLVTQLLIDFPHLTRLDVRDNPMTLGFYAPLQVLVPTKDAATADAFVLPDADFMRNEVFASRLDETTRLRKRLHQVAFVANCRRLRMLDGLPVRRKETLTKDELLVKLIDDGLIPDPESLGSTHQPSENQKTVEVLTSSKPDIESVDEETVDDERARAQLESEAEFAWQHDSTLRSR